VLLANGRSSPMVPAGQLDTLVLNVLTHCSRRRHPSSMAVTLLCGRPPESQGKELAAKQMHHVDRRARRRHVNASAGPYDRQRMKLCSARIRSLCGPWLLVRMRHPIPWTSTRPGNALGEGYLHCGPETVRV